MSTMTASDTLDVSRTNKVSMATLVKVELRKMFDSRAGIWLLGISMALVLIANAVALIVFATQDIETEYGGFVSITAYVSGLFLPVLGILLVTQEWGQRTALVTFALEPRRARVIGAKAIAGVLISFACVVLGLVVGLVMNLLYGAVQGPISWDLGGKYVLGFIATQLVAMMAGFALAALTLNTPAAIVLFVAYTFVLPTLLALAGALAPWFEKIRPWVDFMSAQQPLSAATMDAEKWGHLATSGFIWLVLPLAFGMWRIFRAEVK